MRFGYDGAPFHGWARQPGRRTVEGDLRDRLVRRGVAASSESIRLEVSSRTDRGVSSRHNALSLTTELPGPVLLRVLNSVAPEIYFTAATPVSDDFRVRSAVERVYRYFEPGRDRDFEAWRTAAGVLTGDVDVRSFGRSVPGKEPIWRTIDSLTVTPRRGGAVVEVRARSFVWGMVRKLIGALREHENGRLPLARLVAGARGRERLSLPMAEPEGLVLWEVRLPIRWKVLWDGPTRRQLSYAQSTRNALRVRSEVLRSLGAVGFRKSTER